MENLGVFEQFSKRLTSEMEPCSRLTAAGRLGVYATRGLPFLGRNREIVNPQSSRRHFKTLSAFCCNTKTQDYAAKVRFDCLCTARASYTCCLVELCQFSEIRDAQQQ